MGPMFTSRDEWNALAPAGRPAYLRSAVGHTLKAGALGMVILVLAVGAAEPYWRSAPVLVVAGVSLLAGGAAAYAFFRREWVAAEREYGASA